MMSPVACRRGSERDGGFERLRQLPVLKPVTDF